MLTPQNIREKTFERAIFGGYDMGAVDDFLEEAAGSYAAIAKENMVLKSKMKVLVEKIEEYRSTEDSMRLTLLSAQKLSAQIEQETRDKCDLALTDAHNEAERITREAYTQRALEEAKLLEARRSSAQFIENIRLLCTKQLALFEGFEGMSLEDFAPAAVAPAPAPTVEDTVRSIENSVERLNETPDAGEEIRRTVTDSADILNNFTDEPTRMFSGTGASGKGVNIDSLHFGK
ncbi:MAG: DivIVA domain-containing protein [Oscillospiraceae bacterium]